MSEIDQLKQSVADLQRCYAGLQRHYTRLELMMNPRVTDDELDYESDSVKTQWRSHIYPRNDQYYLPSVTINILPIEYDNGIMHVLGDENAQMWANVHYDSIRQKFKELSEKHALPFGPERLSATVPYVMTDAHQKDIDACKMLWSVDQDVAKGLCKHKHVKISFL